MKIILADDDHNMVRLLKTVLDMQGYKVGTLLDKTGDLISNIKYENPDFLIMDIHLGDKNGLELIHLLRADPDTQKIKVIMVSGMELKSECLEAGADAFLLKPYMPDDLLSLLRG